MKIASLVARILLSLIFVVFGLNGFLQFIPAPPQPAGLAAEFTHALMASHYQLVVAGLQVIGGALLLVSRFVPLGLTILGPIIVNILLVHIFLLPQGLPVALVVVILWVLAFYPVRANFSGIFQQGTST